MKVSRKVDTVTIELDVLQAGKLAFILANVLDQTNQGDVFMLVDQLRDNADVRWSHYEDTLWSSYTTAEPSPGALVIVDKS